MESRHLHQEPQRHSQLHTQRAFHRFAHAPAPARYFLGCCDPPRCPRQELLTSVTLLRSVAIYRARHEPTAANWCACIRLSPQSFRNTLDCVPSSCAQPDPSSPKLLSRPGLADASTDISQFLVPRAPSMNTFPASTCLGSQRCQAACRAVHCISFRVWSRAACWRVRGDWAARPYGGRDPAHSKSQ